MKTLNTSWKGCTSRDKAQACIGANQNQIPRLITTSISEHSTLSGNAIAKTLLNDATGGGDVAAVAG